MKVAKNSIMKITEDGKIFSNLSKEEKQALNDLKNDKTIVIKSADKGSAVIFRDRDDYCKEADSQLLNKEVYVKIESDPIPQLTKKLRIFLKKEGI